MRHSRLLLIGWAVLTLLVAGAWVHSLYRYSGVGYGSPSLNRQIGLRVRAGSFEVLWSTLGRGSPGGLMSHSRPWKHPGTGKTDRPRTFGRFWWRTFTHHDRTGTYYSRTNIEVPFWFLILLLTLLTVLLHRFFARKQSRISAAPLTPDP